MSKLKSVFFIGAFALTATAAQGAPRGLLDVLKGATVAKPAADTVKSCTNFSGKYLYKCGTDDTAYPLTIKQDGCEHIDFHFENLGSDVGLLLNQGVQTLTGEARKGQNDGRWGTQEFTNRLRWRHDGQVIQWHTAYRFDGGTIFTTSEIRMVNGQLVETLKPQLFVEQPSLATTTYDSGTCIGDRVAE